MKRFASSMLVLGLLAVAGSASAQSGYYGRDSYPQPNVDRYGDSYGAQYDMARVVRVDPVIERGYGPDQGSYQGNGYGGNGGYQRCRSRQDGYYAGNDGDDDGNGGYRDDGYARGGGTQAGSNVATVIGGILGAALGSQVGGGSARYATAAVGTMVGGMAGRQIYDSNNRYSRGNSGTVTVCDPEPANGGYYQTSNDRVSGYDVTYEYAGRRYTTRTDYNPGNTIRVRVDVRPE